MRRKQFPEAAQAHEEFLRILIPFGEAASENALISMDLGTAWAKVAEASLAAGDLDRAHVAGAESLKLSISLTQADPTNVRAYRYLRLAFLNMEKVHHQSSEFEEERHRYEECVALLAEFEKSTGSSRFDSAMAVLKEPVEGSDSAE